MLLMLLMLSSSCPPQQNSSQPPNPIDVDPIEDPYTIDLSQDREEEEDFESACRRGDTQSDELSVRELDFVDSNNVGSYFLKGTCEKNKSLVYITVSGYELNRNPKCANRRWEVYLDLTAIIAEQGEATFEITHNKESICRSARVAFSGPKNYIPIPPLKGYYESGFYVMKYEARIERKGSSYVAVSTPKDLPARRVTYQEALQLCQNNGSRYDLIKNSQWQNIARHIESVDENWSEGLATPSDDNALNCGVFSGPPKAASSNDRDDCASSKCASNWDKKRRTHFLPNGEVIWDICGNLAEMMKDKYKREEDFDDYVYLLSSGLKRLFGPKKNYAAVSTNRRDSRWNLGYAKIDSSYDLIVRGAPGDSAGVFSVDVTSDQAQRSSRRGSGQTGFRCVYIP